MLRGKLFKKGKLRTNYKHERCLSNVNSKYSSIMPPLMMELNTFYDSHNKFPIAVNSYKASTIKERPLMMIKFSHYQCPIFNLPQDFIQKFFCVRKPDSEHYSSNMVETFKRRRTDL